MNKKIFIVLLVLIIYGSKYANSQLKNCDCTIFPFKPDSCVRICMARIIQTADTLELTLIIGIDSDLSNKIYSFRNNGIITDIKDLKSAFSPAEFKSIKSAMDKLNELQIQYFNNPYDKRKTILAEWKTLDLNKRPA